MKCKEFPLASLLVLSACTATPSVPPQLATSPPTARDYAEARRLFTRGKELFEAGEYAKACPLFAASETAYPNSNTVYMQGLCVETRTCGNRLEARWAGVRLSRQSGKPNDQSGQP